jgi:hypothetical protein
MLASGCAGSDRILQPAATRVLLRGAGTGWLSSLPGVAGGMCGRVVRGDRGSRYAPVRWAAG